MAGCGGLSGWGGAGCGCLHWVGLVDPLLHLMQDRGSGQITFYMKGADVVMMSKVQYNDWVEEEVCEGVWSEDVWSEC